MRSCAVGGKIKLLKFVAREREGEKGKGRTAEKEKKCRIMTIFKVGPPRMSGVNGRSHNLLASAIPS